jgi:hypothetical protein
MYVHGLIDGALAVIILEMIALIVFVVRSRKGK